MTTTTDSFRWFKSSYSNNGGDCIEVAGDLVVMSGTVPVRDSKNPHGPILTFPPGAWSSFVTSVKDAAELGL
ncbi:DUF397 domain-containing protein [Streptomyces sp. NPDC001407]|uniref:DUF397 domain-containing protein n=1 Tax=unclassified Streptomyces TaxID=2593676 RepID=UPI003411DDBE